MSISGNVCKLALAGLLFSATAAVAQTGGADVPSNAKGAGAMENGASSTGMKGGGSMKMKHHSMKKKHKHM